MAKNFQASLADRLIAGDFLFSYQNIRVALRQMKRYGQFTEKKPARYWHTILRNLWLDHLRDARSHDEGLEINDAYSIPNRSDCYVALVPESSHPLNSIINFLLLTLHLSFVCKMPVLKRALALQKRKKGAGLHHVQKMPVLRSAQRLQVLSC